MDHKRFYRELGKLLYAVAASDGKIHPAEVQRMRQMVRDEIAPLEGSRDQFGTDNAYYAEFEFETLADRDFPAADAFYSFVQYFREFKEHIDPEMKNICLKSADNVANALRGVNASESVMLKNLKEEIK